MSRVLILGYGNTLRSDDGAGWRAAEELRGASIAGLDVRALPQLGPELALDVAEAGAVVFVDSSVTAPPGELAVREVSPPPPDAGFTHNVTPGALLELAAALGGARPPAWEVTIGGASFALGEGLSPEVEARMASLQALLRRFARALAS
jgi:hydrogenase maturation protease